MTSGPDADAAVTRPRIAFVVQRAGLDVNGGSEYQCLAVARALATIWDIEILTTCARDYRIWADHYPPGVERVDGVTIRRFPVDQPRNPSTFDRLSRKLRPRLKTSSLAEQEEWMRAQGPYSTALLRFIEAQHGEFEMFVFFTYLYATTYFGLPLVAAKAVLVPFAHDEWPIHAALWDAFFQRPAGFVFNTPEEREFLARRFPAAVLAGPTIAMGVTPPADARPERFRQRYKIDAPFIAYVGRIDASKGVDRLLEHFARYKKHHHDDLELVLIGRAEQPLRKRPFVRAVGFVEEEAKFDALAGAEVVVVPSPFESLSIVLLEAWSVGRPVLVTAASDVLVGQTRRAQGGLRFMDEAEFVAALSQLRGPSGNRFGASGRAFVEREYRWPRVVEQYEDLRLRMAHSNRN
jgi:glycosyltransferase involved in cell wall biosynthesis